MHSRPPFWNIASLLAPFAGIGIGLLIPVSSAGEFVGLAQGLYLVLFVGLASFLGVGAAIAALWRRERFRWLSVLGALVNAALVAVIAPGFLKNG